MKTIATLTFQDADSYGAMMQAYGLQKAIEKLGFDTELLNYDCKKVTAEYAFPKSAKRLIGRLLRTPFYQIRRNKFKKFRKDFLKIGARYNSTNITKASEKYDAFVVGSDQVWNSDITGADTTYFLDFAGVKKKISYAASIGLRSWSQLDEAQYASLLKKFDYISVRERTAKDYLSELGVDAVMSIDPTFLIDKSEYINMMQSNNVQEDYTLLFCLENPNEEMVAFAKKVAKTNGEKLVVMHTGRIHVRGVLNVRSAGPCEFLSYIYNASHVITESFHGCCFSIIFNKQFYYVGKNTNDSSLDRSSRIVDLLTLFGLDNRNKTCNRKLESDIEYSIVNRKITQERSKCLDQLKEALA